MKQIAFLIVLFFTIINVFGQNEIAVERTVRRVDTSFSLDKVFNKETGENVTEREFQALLKINPNLPLEPVTDNYGNIVKYLYDPATIHEVTIKYSTSEKVKKGDYYPELVFRTIKGETIKLKDLKGKMVVLRIEMDAESFRYKKDEIKELDDAINNTGRGSEIEAIILFAASKQEIENGVDLLDSNFQLVPNGINFHRKLHVKYFPWTVILDKEGRLLEETKWSEDLNIMELLNKA